MRKSRFPYQYEDSLPLYAYTEPGADGSAHLDVESLDNPDLKRLMEAVGELKVGETIDWIKTHRNEFSASSAVYDGSDDKELLQMRQNASSACNKQDTEQAGAAGKRLIVLTAGLDEVKELNRLLNASSEVLENGGYLWIHTRTSGSRKASLMASNVPVIRNIVFFFWYIWYRIFPKLLLTSWFYRLCERMSGTVKRCYHRVEILGRIYRAGFEVVDEGFRCGHLYVIGQKVKPPMYEDEPSGSPIIKLHRVGKGGKMIPVFKFRTMHSYSEYLQPYIYKYNSLAEGGKFANDYRIAGYGRFLRKYWLDELPMLWNYIRREVKLVGVRPISKQYYSLYSNEMQELRIKTRPGILPPFYYDQTRPKDIEEVQQSERRYIESYLKKPFRTDWRYFWGTVRNILFRGARSK